MYVCTMPYSIKPIPLRIVCFRTRDQSKRKGWQGQTTLTRNVFLLTSRRSSLSSNAGALGQRPQRISLFLHIAAGDLPCLCLQATRTTFTRSQAILRWMPFGDLGASLVRLVHACRACNSADISTSGTHTHCCACIATGNNSREEAKIEEGG